MKESALLIAFRAQLRAWLNAEKGWPYNGWTIAKQGAIYARYNSISKTLTLANFVIKKRYHGRGIARSLIHEAMAHPFKVVRIESIAKDGWFQKLKSYTFPGYETKIIDQGDQGIQYNIDFIRI